MVLESEFQKRYCGTYCIYKDIDRLSRTAPRFLNRNLRHSLDIKQEELARSKGRRTNNSRPGQPVIDLYAGVMTERAPTNWYPSADEIEHLARPNTLTLVPREIRLKSATEHVSHNETDVELSWLPAPGWQRLKCDVACILAHDEAGIWRTSYQESRSATLHCSSSSDTGSLATVKVDAPFVIPHGAIFKPLPNKADALPDKPPKFRKARVRLLITCPKPGANQDLHRLLRGTDGNSERVTIRTYLYDIEKFTNGEEEKVVDLVEGLQDYVMQVGLAWNSLEANRSTLSTVNKLKGDIRHMMSDPSSLQPQNTTSAINVKDYAIRYVFSGTGEGTKPPTRTLVATTLACPLCKSRLPQSSFPRLRFHYLISHDHFKFDVHEQHEDDGLLSATIHVSLQDPKCGRASNDAPDPREMAWVRPVRPFDLQKFIKGNDSWDVGRGQLKKIAHKSPSRDSGMVQTIGRWGAKAPDAVEKLEPPRPKRFPVPNIPGVVLYRSLTKRKLRTGEELSESDEYSDTETWAARKQRKRTPPIIGNSQGAFFDLWDHHVHQERIPSDIHLTDTLIRFCNRHRRELKKPAMRKDFILKLDQLRLTGRISDEVRSSCIDTVDETEASKWHSEDKDAIRREVQIYCGTYPEQNGVSGDDEPKRDSGIEDVGLAHPLSAHPKVKRMLKQYAYHPEINPHLTTLVLDDKLENNRRSTRGEHNPEAHRALVARCCQVMGDENPDSSDEELHRSDTPTDRAGTMFRKWVAGLKANKEATAVRGRKASVNVSAGLCVCGRPADQDRGVIMCSNARCRRGTFHLACVNLNKRDPHWKCKACSNGGPRERSTEWVTRAEEGAQYPLVE